jgi:superfamily II DNA or RNA helicase
VLALRDYQREAIQAILRKANAGVRRQLLHLPTGAGKTIVAAALSEKARGRVLMLVHRDELVHQSVEKFGYVWPGGDIGVVKAERDEGARRVVVASVQTLVQPERLNRLDAGSFSLVIVDEAHHATAPSQMHVLEGLGVLPETAPGRLLLGITATPARSDGVGLGQVFEETVYHKSIEELIEAGYLADVKGIRVETHLDLNRVRTTGGDFNSRDLSLAVDTENRNRLIAEAYEHYGEGAKAVIFTVDVTHAQHVTETLLARGHKADWVSGELPLMERRRRLERFRDGETTILANALVLVEGWDEPTVGCVVMARPTRSQALFTQAVGRGLRPYPGKNYCIILDMADTRQDLVTLADLEGFRKTVERQPRKAEAPTGMAERAPAADDHLADAKLVATPMDLLARSAFRWHVEGGRRMRLEAGPGQDVFLRKQDGGLWQVVLHSRDGETDLAGQPLPLDYAQGVAEEHIRQNGLGWFAGKDAQWRSRPASDKQVDLLRSLGVDPEEGLTRERAQDLIRETLRSRALNDPDAPWRSQPASARQIQWMEKHHFRVREGLTKGEVADVMERLAGRRAAR